MESILDLNLYDILNVPSNASQSEIKKAYYREVKKYHPDNEHYDKEKWQLLQLAYEVLSNEEQRKKYNKQYCLKHGKFKNSIDMSVEDALSIYEAHHEREEKIWDQYNKLYYEILFSLKNSEEIKIINEKLNKLNNKKCNNILDILRNYQHKI